MATIDRINRLQRQLTASTSRSTGGQLHTDPGHIAQVWKGLKVMGMAERFLSHGLTMADVDAFIEEYDPTPIERRLNTDDYRSGTDS